jgi:nucleoside-diphosphate-sugar epimerase
LDIAVKSLNESSVLVTGAGGFLGSVITEHLRKQGTRVVGTARGQEYHNKHKLLCLDLENTADLKFLDTDGPYGAVIHCAAALPGKIADSELVSVNQRMTYNLLKWAIDSNVRNFLFASSCNIYGYLGKPCTELAVPQPPNIYAVSKIACEYMINAMSAGTDMKVCILRISAPYGPSSSAETVIKIFLKQASQNDRITLMGTGSRSQDFVYQSDVANAFHLALLRDAEGTFNVSGNRPVRMLELAEIVSRMFNRTCDNGIILSGVDPQESYRGCFPTTAATTTFGYFPQVELEDGLKRTAKAWGLM